MDFKDGKTEYGEVPTVPPIYDDDYSLEEILAEFGGSRQQKIMEDVEREIEPEPSADVAPESEKAARPPRKKHKEKPAPPPEPVEPEVELPEPPRPISLEEVVGSTVSAVMEEQQEPLLRPRRGLFSRRKLEETEQLYASMEIEAEPEPEEEPIGPEKEPSVAAACYREAYRRQKKMLLPAWLIAVIPTGLMVAEQYGVVIPYWTGDLRFQSIVLLTCLALLSVLCRSVYVRGVSMLLEKRCVSELLAALAALAALGDCVVCLAVPTRTAVSSYGAVACMSLAFAQWGVCRGNRGLYDTFRTAALDEQPPYLITDTERGACKQKGSVPGFYTTAMRSDASTLMQTVLLPVVLMAAIVFAGLTSFGKGSGADFLLHWSAVLSAGATFSLPLCWALPWSLLTRHLQKVGCAVAGWSGAEKISRRKCMILTDVDLFPPGTIQLNGVKVYGEEMRKAASYAATMARCAGSGLERLLDRFLRGEGGAYEQVHSFSFFEEGGWSATIRGESVLMGTASFMRKMEVRLPSDINLKTGIFLSVDHELIAVFAVKYNPSENVDFALRMMRRSHITPILASRDPNITPALLKRKFHKGVRVEYPNLTSRVALSEAGLDRNLPRALLFREGLLPYAETVVGSRRLCRAAVRGTVLSLLGSMAGTLLAAYLTSLGAFELLTPLALEAFLLLWTLPVFLMTDWVKRY